MDNEENEKFLEDKKLGDIDKPRIINKLKGTSFRDFKTLGDVDEFDADDFLDAYEPDIDFELRFEAKPFQN